jgi:hypothetical protein
MNSLTILVFTAVLCVASAYNGFMKSNPRHSTRLYEDFNLKRTNIVSAKEIFTEKQLREFTSTYSVDERWNPFGLFGKKETPAAAPSSVEKALKPTVSLSVLEEKTAQYVVGKITAASYYATLKAAFGDKIKTVLPDILANLSSSKAADLKKAAK